MASNNPQGFEISGLGAGSTCKADASPSSFADVQPLETKTFGDSHHVVLVLVLCRIVMSALLVRSIFCVLPVVVVVDSICDVGRWYLS